MEKEKNKVLKIKETYHKSRLSDELLSRAYNKLLEGKINKSDLKIDNLKDKRG